MEDPEKLAKGWSSTQRIIKVCHARDDAEECRGIEEEANYIGHLAESVAILSIQPLMDITTGSVCGPTVAAARSS